MYNFFFIIRPTLDFLFVFLFLLFFPRYLFFPFSVMQIIFSVYNDVLAFLFFYLDNFLIFSIIVVIQIIYTVIFTFVDILLIPILITFRQYSSQHFSIRRSQFCLILF